MKKLLTALAFFCLIGAGQADLIAFTFGSAAGPRTDIYTIGNTFDVGADDLSVTSLGFLDWAANGLAASHQVAIWDSSGASIASATVPSGTTAPLAATYYRVQSITPVVLLAGQSYTVGAYTNGGDIWNDAGAGSAIIPNAAITNVDSVFKSGTFGRPTTDGGLGNQRWGPANFEFNAMVVPEPSHSVLVVLGGMVLLLLRKRC